MKLITSFLICFSWLGLAQHSIEGTFSPAEDFSYAFIYKATSDGAEYVDRAKLNASGTFTITLDTSATAGIYKIVYAVPPEENNFDFIYSGKEDVRFNFSLENGVNFTTSDENILWNSYLKSMDMVHQTISNYYNTESKDQTAFEQIFKTLKNTQTAYEEEAASKLVYTFITSNRPYIPESYEDLSTYAENLKANYFKNVDFGNPILQSSSFLSDRVMAYIFNMVNDPNNDDYKTLVDDVAKAIPNDQNDIKSNLLNGVWQVFVEKDNHDLANYIADQYLIQLAQDTGNKALEQSLRAYKNTSVGTKAPNFKLPLNAVDSLHDLEGSDYYLLVFWSSGCGHCLKELPRLKNIISNNKWVQVVAFGLENNKDSWESVIKKYPVFIHVLGLKKWDNSIVETYGITATPTYFLLDKNKTIISKPYDVEAVEKVLKTLNTD